ncbi:MAG: Arylsulfatase [Phycisphaerae bacterium]|nr:Arylsulfatase [Phycisphaerae bacterium]
MARTTGDRPNVVVFFTDQQRWDSMGLHGNPLELTPNLDRMAAEGTFPACAFTPQPVCGPARACLQTGLYATQTGCFTNGRAHLTRDYRTLADCFNDAGYRTGYIGKWHLGGPDDGGEAVSPEYRGGYADWLAANCLEFTSDAYRTRMFDAESRPHDLPGYRVDAVADCVIRYIDRHRDDPFFLFSSFIEPHFQNHLDDYPAPDGYRERYTGRWTPADLAALGGTTHQHLGGYWGMVKRLDEAFGRVLDALKSLDLRRNTVVLFTSDHGCHFKTRNGEYKRSCHDSSIRVPMALSGPGFDGGGRLRQLVSLLDMPPTLLDACGLQVPPAMKGRSILPLLGGRDVPDWPTDVFAQISESQVGRCVRTQRWKYGVDAPGADTRNDAGAERYVEQYLYDLASDPHELRNLVDLKSHRVVCDVMRERLLRRLADAGEPPATIDPPPEIRPAGQRRVTADEALM